MDNLCPVCIVILAVACVVFVLLSYGRRRSSSVKGCPLSGSSPLSLEQPVHTGSIIHLRERTDRDQNVRNLLDAARAAGIDLRVFEAADGRSCPDVTVLPFWDYSATPGNVRSTLRGGEQGCLASFLELFSSPDSGKGRFFIEDDAVVSMEGFRNVARAVSARATASLVFHGMRAYPRGWDDTNATRRREAASAGELESGWCDVLCPNYSNAMFAVTAAGTTALREWVGKMRRAGLHELPADDFLSVAGNAHPGVNLPPMKQHWEGAPRGPLRILAPVAGNEQSTRITSSSDTERRTPLRGSPTDNCALLRHVNADAHQGDVFEAHH